MTEGVLLNELKGQCWIYTWAVIVTGLWIIVFSLKDLLFFFFFFCFGPCKNSGCSGRPVGSGVYLKTTDQIRMVDDQL